MRPTSRLTPRAVVRLVTTAVLLALVPPLQAVTLKIYVHKPIKTPDGKVRKIDDRHFGLNTVIWDQDFNDPKTLKALQDLKMRSLRFPGGSRSDTYDWKSNKSYIMKSEPGYKPGKKTLNSWEWWVDFDDFAKVALKLKAEAFITVNYGTGTPKMAADWVKYSKKKKYGFKYWEIGNECYGTWEEDVRSKPWDPETYATEAAKYMKQMRAADPSIKIGVVAVPGEDSYGNSSRKAMKNPRTKKKHKGWTPIMLAKLKSLKAIPDFIIHHRYEQDPKYASWRPQNYENDAKLLQSAKGWADDAKDLRQQLKDYLGSKNAKKVELVCTENNSVSSMTGKQTVSLVNGLYLADSFGQLTKTEFNSLTWWALRNGRDKNANNDDYLYGWRNYGDYGIMYGKSTKFPTFHVMQMLASFARKGDTVVKTKSSTSMLGCYAVKRKNGNLTVLVINKHPTKTYKPTVKIGGYKPASTATALRYGKKQDDAARLKKSSSKQKPAKSTLKGIKKESKVSFEPYSVTVLTFTPKK